jgi:hemerythrin
MESFRWDDQFETGIDEVDTQHHHLVKLINRFGEKISENQVSLDDIRELYSKLTDYAKHHFQAEEAMMLETALAPDYVAGHHAEHRRFLNELEAIYVTLSSDQAAISKQLLDFLVHWLVYHILVKDKEMAAQITAVQAGTSPEAAYAQLEQHSDRVTQPLLNSLSTLFEVISARNKTLQQLNENLEDKVAERTRALTEANAQLKELALTDVLTQLPNRRHAMRQLAALWAESLEADLPLACIMIDADHFKEVNDNQGHDAGDEVLRSLGTTLQHAMRTDDIVSRLGGDEFLAICPNTDAAGGLYVAELIRQAVSRLRVPTGSTEWTGSVSIGVAVRQADMQKPDELLKAADEGVYAAKRAGKNCVRSIQAVVS